MNIEQQQTAEAPIIQTLTREEILARKRDYNKQYRARIKQGLPGALRRKFPHELEEPQRCIKCGKEFSNPRGLAMHKIRKHGKGWSTVKNFKNKKLQKAQRLRRQREASLLLNGTAPVAQPQDNLAESARAIIMAAQVLRSVSVGMKL